MARSMTGYASREGRLDAWSWTWEIRSVNARGLDIKLRIPDWLPGLDQAIRQRVSKKASRGNVSVSLRLTRAASDALSLDDDALDAALRTLTAVTERAAAAGLTLQAPTALELLQMRGVSESAQASDEEVSALSSALLSDLDALLPDFVAYRAREGAATAEVLTDALAQVETGIEAARGAVAGRAEAQANALRKAMAQVLDLAGQDAPDPQRIAQELAILAVKSDVSEELDRLASHVAGARDILNDPKPKGRKLDFLMQEFNREANTLCSKSSDTTLTQMGLDMKVIVDQMREQVQNLE